MVAVVGCVVVVVGFVVAVVAVVLVVLVVVVVAVARWGCCCRAFCRGALLLKGSFGLLLVSLAGLGSSWALLWVPWGISWGLLGRLGGAFGIPGVSLGLLV